MTGFESSVLVFVAQRPEALAQFEDRLSADALAIGRALTGAPASSPDVARTAAAIHEWAEARRKREAEERGPAKS